jgi:hypothetical protein
LKTGGGRHISYLHLVILLRLFASKSRCFYNRLGMVLKEQELFKDPKLLRDFCFLDFAWDWRVHNEGSFIQQLQRKQLVFYE